MTKYTLGFIFNKDLDKVILIYLNKPSQWNDKLFNGIGGHIDGDEVPCYGMTRECKEETGLDIPVHNWVYAGKFHSKEFEISTFCTTIKEENFYFFETEEGIVNWYELNDIMKMRTASNTKWMIPLCLDLLRGNLLTPFNIQQ